MNILTGKIESVRVCENLSLVKVNASGIILSAIVIDTPRTAPYLQTGNTVHTIFKETEVIIGKGGLTFPVSLRNRIPGRIVFLEKGELLSKLVLETAVGEVVSVITSHAVEELSLAEGVEVVAMVKTNEMMLSE